LDRRITQAGLANSFLHTLCTQFSYASQLCCESVFSFCYAFCFALSDAHYSVIAYAVASGDAINTGVWLGEFSGDSAVRFGARPEQGFAGVATLVALREEPLLLDLAIIWLGHVQANMVSTLGAKCNFDVTIIEIRPFRNGWQVL
jgi:hypothetical protein